LVVDVPSDVKLEVKAGAISVSGPLGTLEKRLGGASVEITPRGIIVKAPPALAGTIESHIRNMVRGVREGYTIKLQMVYSHFPLSVEAKGRQVIVKNFMGEKQPRVAEVVGSTKVEVKPPIVILSGVSKEEVGQTAANIRAALRIAKRDSRVFQDGLYPVEE